MSDQKLEQLRRELNLVARVDYTLSLESKWTQGTLARNEKGLRTNPNYTDAACFCLRGAIEHAQNGMTFCTTPAVVGVVQRMDRLARARSPKFPTLVEFNDDKQTTFQNVRELIGQTMVQIAYEIADLRAPLFEENPDDQS